MTRSKLFFLCLIEIPLKLIGFVVAGYFLRLPVFQYFIFITNQRKDGRYEKSFWDLTFLVFYICVFTALRAAIMDYVLIPVAKYCNVPLKKHQRFAEQSWACIYYTFAFSFGIVSNSWEKGGSGLLFVKIISRSE